MAASGFTPIQLYYSTTTTNIPLAGNLATGELAVNAADGKLYYKNSVSGLVRLLADGSVASGNLPGGAAGTVVYQSATGVTAYLTLGASGFLLTSNGTNPQYTNPTSITVGNATAAVTSTNLASGAVGSVPYQTGAGATSFLGLGTTNFVLTAGAIGPQYVAQNTLSVGSATTAGTSTNVAGGTTGAVVYQTAASTTSTLTLGTTNFVLTAGASAPQYVAQSTLSVGSAVTATNIAGGAANQITYQTGAGATSFIAAPSITGYVLGWTGSAFAWVNAPMSTTATNLSGGSAGVVPYQTGSGTTAFTAVGTVGYSLVSQGTGTPTWNQVSLSAGVTGTLPIANGGTGQTTASAAFNALSPVTTAGDLIVGNGVNSATRLAIGTNGTVLQSNGTTASWVTFTSGSSLSNDTSTATNLFPMFANATTGTPTTVFTSNAKYLYQPSTGTLTASQLNASNGFHTNATTLVTSYTVPSGINAMTVGPFTVPSGLAVTVTSGQRWLVL